MIESNHRRPADWSMVRLATFIITIVVGFNLVRNSDQSFQQIEALVQDVKAPSSLSMHITGGLPDSDSSSVQQGNIDPKVVYGHVHEAKTGGTSLNGMLAARYERVCGNKGYSFDAYQSNVRRKQKIQNDTVKQLKRGFHRSRVPHFIMDERGYENCDWISKEIGWFWWKKFVKWPLHIELHVPCREPVDHLMSKCNFKRNTFDCSGDLATEVEKCMLKHARFHYNLTNLNNTSIKCFDYNITFTKYMDLMDKTLQRKRMPIEYAIRATNRRRKFATECIWQNDTLRLAVEKYLIEKYPYYNFCDACIGSKEDMFAA